MYKHPHFNLWILDDDELSTHLGSRVSERVTVHEWPLSTVQKVTCEDGLKMIFKSQYGPTVEPEFYAKAKSPILPKAQTLRQSDLHSCMLIEFIEAPLVTELTLSEGEVLKISDEITGRIDRINGNPPVFLDISTLEQWMLLVDNAISSLVALVESGRFQLTSLETVWLLDRLARSSMVASVYDDDIGFIHSDLNKGNIFVCHDGYRVIDWQRPIRGPKVIDKVDFLRSLGVDASKHVSRGAVITWLFLTIWWFEQCQTHWITAGNYDKWVSNLAAEMTGLAPKG